MTDFDRLTRISRDEVTAIQNERLARQVAYEYERVPFYKESLDAAGVSPGDIRGVEDLHKLPFTHKYDIQDRFPWGLCAVEPKDIARIHSSSGTTGLPVSHFYTKSDMANWGECMARVMATAGATSEDISQIAFRYSLFTGAFGHHLGAETLGAAIIPTSSGQTDRQIFMMQSYGTTVLHCTSSYSVVVAEKMEEMGVDGRKLPLRLGMHGAEPMSNAVRDEVQERLGYRVARDYGLTELGGCGVSGECEAQDGYHINEDHFYTEVIDPETGVALPEGEIGELVFTTLAKEGTPVLRYRSRDLASLTREPCACGRTTMRHSLILGRTDDMLIVSGVNFFPTQVESVLMSFEHVAPHYLIRVSMVERREVAKVECELAPEAWAAMDDQARASLQAGVCQKLRDKLGFKMDCAFLEPFSLPRSEGKTKHVIDERTEAR